LHTHPGGAGAPTEAATAAIWTICSPCMCRRCAVPLEDLCFPSSQAPPVQSRSSPTTTIGEGGRPAGRLIHRRIPSLH
jgi:hypothetical protein